MVDKELSTYLEKAEVHTDINGSDHCPISATFHSLMPIPADKPPMDAAKNFKEFCGKQMNLKDFLNRNGHIPSQNSFDLSGVTKSKKNAASDTKQANITKFFVKKPKLADNTKSMQADQNVESNWPEYKEFSDVNQDASKKWKNLLTTPNTPSCTGHNEPCVLRTVKKKGLNQGRKFWACSRGVGQSNDPNANCNHFAWVNAKS